MNRFSEVSNRLNKIYFKFFIPWHKSTSPLSVCSCSCKGRTFFKISIKRWSSCQAKHTDDQEYIIENQEKYLSYKELLFDR
jgi:hypothetical protein